uniref:Uncharacterized protein n=1 Tax=Rhizophora mucronata TaxID=61149 RepID=A0A2P2MXC0_RHIMU
MHLNRNHGVCQQGIGQTPFNQKAPSKISLARINRRGVHIGQSSL